MGRVMDAPSTLAVRLVVSDRVALQSAAGEDITPRGRKACAALAMLGRSDSLSLPRAVIERTLWSDRGAEQQTNSFRQALHEIRRKLEPFPGALRSDRQSVGLDRNLVDIRFSVPSLSGPDRSGGGFLAGLKIRDPEFEKWRVDAAADLARPGRQLDAVSKSDVPNGAPAIRRGARPDVWARVVPTSLEGDRDRESDFYARVINAAITRGISEYGVAEPTNVTREEPGVEIRSEVNVVPGGVAVHLELDSAHDGQRLWSGTQFAPETSEFICNIAELQRLINHAVDIAVLQLRNITSKRDDFNALGLGFAALSRTTSRDPSDLALASQELESALDRERAGITLAWQAYLLTFQAGELLVDRKACAEAARALTSEALATDPHNSSVLALTSYVHSFILGDYGSAHELARRSHELNPLNPLSLAFLGRAKSYIGDHDQAYDLARRASLIAGPGPYRSTIDFLAGVTASSSGQLDDAIRLHEAVRAVDPKFRAPLRYLLALYAKQGALDKARKTFETLRKFEPGLTIQQMRDPSYPAAGLRAAGLLDFEETDFR